MNKCLNIKKELVIFLIIFIVSMIIFIPFLKPHYATDSYYIANEGYQNYVINNSLKDGRILMAGIGCIAELTNTSIELYSVILTILALITCCISVIILKNMILKYKKAEKLVIEILVIFMSYFTIFNFMFIENMLFVECFVMSLSILFYMLAARTLVNKDKYYFLKAVILIILGILSYQGTISMYFITLLVFSLIKNKNYKQTIKDLILGGSIAVFGICIQLLFIRCSEAIFSIHQARVSSIKNIPINIISTIKYLLQIIINTGFVYPKYLWIIFILILEMFVFIKVYKEKTKECFLYNQILIVFFSILFGLAVSFISTSGFWSARIRFSIGTTIGFLLMHIYCKTDLLEKRKTINLIILSIFITYALSIVVNYNLLMKNTLKVNAKDKEVAQEILEYVENYEQKNNIKVNKLAVLYGPCESKAYYKELKYNGSVLSWSSIRTQWSIEGTLEMYSNREFDFVQPTQEELNYYKNNVDKEKDYMCIDNTLFVSYYIN